MKKITRNFCLYLLFPLTLLTIIALASPTNLGAAGNADNFIFTGSATSSYTIEVPPGRKGVAPQLTLTYNSMSGNGWLGIGWELSMGHIVRNTKYGVPSYDDAVDQFVLSLKGATYEIIPIGGNEYRLKIESQFLKIIKEADNSWTVRDKAGTTYKFGSVGNSSRVTNPQGIFQWNLDRVEDLDGNYMTIAYQPDQGQLYLNSIEYTGNSDTVPPATPRNTVTFVWEARNDVLRSYKSGALITTSKRLDYIATKADEVNTLKYVVEYSDSSASQRSRLRKVIKHGWKSSWVPFPSASVFVYSTDSTALSGTNSMTGDPDKPLSLRDMNRDGLPDAVEFIDPNLYDSLPQQRINSYWPNEGNGEFGNRVDITNAPPAWNMYKGMLFDVDNDGLPDVIRNQDNEPYYYYRNNGDGSFGNQQTLDVPEGIHNIGVYNTIDINGDGLLDLLYTSYSLWEYHPNLGNGSFGSAVNIPNPPQSGCMPFSLSMTSTTSWQFADINGDGLLDFLFSPFSGQNYTQYWPNIGGDFLNVNDSFPNCNNDPQYVTAPSTLADSQYLRYYDMSGDGLADALQVKANDYRYWPNLGNDTFGEAVSLPGPTKDNTTSPGVQLVDIDGDGLNDVVYGDANDYQYWKLQTTDNTYPNLLTSLDNGAGGMTDIAYKSSSNYDNTGDDSMSDCGVVLQFVDSITNHDGMGNSYVMTYDYAGAVYDTANREYLGIGKVTTVRADGNYSETHFLQNGVGDEYIYKGKPELVRNYDVNDILLSEETTAWEYVDTDGGGKYPRVRRITSRLYDSQGDYTETVTENQQFDSYGNIIQSKVSTADGLSYYTKTEYMTDTTNWVFVPEVRYVTAGDPATDTAYLRWQQFFYNEDVPNRYHLTRKRLLKDVSPNTYVEINLTYDDYGNAETVTDANSHSVTTTYDSIFHQYPESVTDGLGHQVTSTFDPKWGVLLTSTDIAGSSMRNEYDEFGRSVASYIPNDNGNPDILFREVDYTIFTGVENPNRVYSKTYVGDGSILEQYTYTDGLGRPLEAKSTGKSGELVGAMTEFDTIGRVLRTSNPYLTTSAYTTDTSGISDWTINEYDAWDRLSKVTAPDGAISTTSVDVVDFQMEITSKDPNYNSNEPWRGKHVAVADGFGRTVEVREHDIDELYATTHYEYSLLGELEKVTDDPANIALMTYNRLGWKRTMDDPDKGNVFYEYDNGGNLRFQTDNKGQQVEFQYDELNRLERKVVPDMPDTVYLYDEVASGYFQKGRLTTIDAPGVVTKFYYDSRGMTVKSEMTIDQTVYQILSGYDNLGRQRSLTYPDGEEVVTNHDGIYEKNMSSTLSSYISDMNYNHNGQMINKLYGNGVQFTYDYYPQNNRLKRILSQKESSTFQDLQFGYDKVGNIKTLDDLAPKHPQNQMFTYDHLYRLVDYELNGQPGTRSYQYDTIGNMRFHSARGTYEYGQNGAGPHAATSVGTLTYTYDDNGNMLTGDGRTLTYDAEDQLTKAKKDGNVVRFFYDQSGTRVKKSSRTTIGDFLSNITLNTETVYLGNLYEIEKVNGYVVKTTKHYHLGKDKIASREIVNGTTRDLYFYHGDQIGSSNVITDEDGNEVQYLQYYPYGEARINHRPLANGVYVPSSTFDVPHKFTGKELDAETGLYYYSARYYDPKLCRFISADDVVPSAFAPQTLNRYSYTANNPINFIDPTGHVLIPTEDPNISWDTDRDRVIIDVSGPGRTDAQFSADMPDFQSWVAEQSGPSTGGRSIADRQIREAEYRMYMYIQQRYANYNRVVNRPPINYGLGTTTQGIPVNTMSCHNAIGLRTGLGFPAPAKVTQISNIFGGYIEAAMWADGLAGFAKLAKVGVNLMRNSGPLFRQGLVWNEVGAIQFTRKGVARFHPNKYWRTQIGRPDLSEANIELITKFRRSPRVDEVWRKFHKYDASWMGDVIELHHIGGGPVLMEIPKTFHRGKGFFLLWH